MNIIEYIANKSNRYAFEDFVVPTTMKDSHGQEKEKAVMVHCHNTTPNKKHRATIGNKDTWKFTPGFVLAFLGVVIFFSGIQCTGSPDLLWSALDGGGFRMPMIINTMPKNAFRFCRRRNCIADTDDCCQVDITQFLEKKLADMDFACYSEGNNPPTNLLKITAAIDQVYKKRKRVVTKTTNFATADTKTKKLIVTAISTIVAVSICLTLASFFWIANKKKEPSQQLSTIRSRKEKNRTDSKPVIDFLTRSLSMSGISDACFDGFEINEAIVAIQNEHWTKDNE